MHEYQRNVTKENHHVSSERKDEGRLTGKAFASADINVVNISLVPDSQILEMGH